METLAKKDTEKAATTIDVQGNLEGAENLPRAEFKVANILNYVYAFMGLIAVVVIIYNAIQYLTSDGDPSRTKKATSGLVYAAIGLGIVLLATVITNVVFMTVGEAQ